MASCARERAGEVAGRGAHSAAAVLAALEQRWSVPAGGTGDGPLWDGLRATHRASLLHLGTWQRPRSQADGSGCFFPDAAAGDQQSRRDQATPHRTSPRAAEAGAPRATTQKRPRGTETLPLLAQRRTSCCWQRCGAWRAAAWSGFLAMRRRRQGWRLRLPASHTRKVRNRCPITRLAAGAHARFSPHSYMPPFLRPLQHYSAQRGPC
jgi:hypothetical protein